MPYEFDDDPDRIQPDVIWDFMSREAYWGRWRSRDDLDRQLASAWRVVGCYDDAGHMVGFARAVSDGVALGYLADVFVLDVHRGKGLGRQLVKQMIEEGPGASFRWLLHTRDAHLLYEEFGFSPPDGTLLERPQAYRREVDRRVP
jgi:GNAT superfamily N-acetyltransferase